MDGSKRLLDSSRPGKRSHRGTIRGRIAWPERNANETAREPENGTPGSLRPTSELRIQVGPAAESIALALLRGGGLSADQAAD